MMTAIYRGWRFAQDARDSYGAERLRREAVPDGRPARAGSRRRCTPRRAAASAAAPQEPLTAAVARGKELLAAGKVSEASAVLAGAVRTDPRSADAQFQLGRALRAAGDPFGAMTALEHAVEASPAHLPALRALAALYEESGFRRKAAEVLERALAGRARRGRARRDPQGAAAPHGVARAGRARRRAAPGSRGTAPPDLRATAADARTPRARRSRAAGAHGLLAARALPARSGSPAAHPRRGGTRGCNGTSRAKPRCSPRPRGGTRARARTSERHAAR